MQKTKSMRLLLTVFFISFLQWSCGQSQPTVQNLGVADFKKALETTASKQLIDVRTDAEVQTGVIANAQQYDLSGPDFQHQLDQLDKNVPVYVYCAVGGRSAQAAQIMAKSGFTQIYNLTDGVQGWVQAGNSLQPVQP